MDEPTITAALEGASDPHVARQRSRELSTLRGVRGVPDRKSVV